MLAAMLFECADMSARSMEQSRVKSLARSRPMEKRFGLSVGCVSMGVSAVVPAAVVIVWLLMFDRAAIRKNSFKICSLL